MDQTFSTLRALVTAGPPPPAARPAAAPSASRHSIAGTPSHGIISTMSAADDSAGGGVSKQAVQQIVRNTLEQSGVRPNISVQQYAKVAGLIADAVTTLSMAALGGSHDQGDVKALQIRTAKLQQRSFSVEQQMSATESLLDREAQAAIVGDNARALLAECESGPSGWPFAPATQATIQEARRTPAGAGLERLLGLHLALGLQCRVTRTEIVTLYEGRVH
jgi:hypothetical protein